MVSSIYDGYGWFLGLGKIMELANFVIVKFDLSLVVRKFIILILLIF